jgi:hypothetical protein
LLSDLSKKKIVAFSSLRLLRDIYIFFYKHIYLYGLLQPLLIKIYLKFWGQFFQNNNNFSYNGMMYSWNALAVRSAIIPKGITKCVFAQGKLALPSSIGRLYMD